MFKKSLLACLFCLPLWAVSASHVVGSASGVSGQSIQTANGQTTQKVNFSPIFIGISDVMTHLKTANTQQASDALRVLDGQFEALPIDPAHQALADATQTAFAQAIAAPNQANLETLSKALYALEQAQNPKDYRQKQNQFAQKMPKAVQTLGQAIERFDQNQNLGELKQAYANFNGVWLTQERTVRNTKPAYYGKIETHMALMRVAIERTPIDAQNLHAHFEGLDQAVQGFIDDKNKPIQEQANPKQGTMTLADGIALLKTAQSRMQTAENAEHELTQFLDGWLIFESEVSSKDPALYKEVEQTLPVIIAKQDAQKLAVLIDKLSRLDQKTHYGVMDSMLILLREGLEALLILVALISALNAARQSQGKKWVYGGVVTGLFASLLGAFLLYKLFPNMAGQSRELIEGAVGVVAVVMMIGVGAWLHSKSSVKAWNRFINTQLKQAVGTGSFVSLFLLSFLAVFREGAETVLFYVGILPAIAMGDFVLGIVLAVLVLALMAWVFLKTSVRLPIAHLFKVLTAIIYAIGFKILGVSILALQLTQVLARTHLSVPSVEWLGFYPSVQGVVAQVCYVWVLIAIGVYQNKKLAQTEQQK